LEGLRSRDLERNTLYVVFGDHGEAFGQHSGNFGHTLFIYDENIRVPYLIAAPGVVKQQIRVGRVASLIDTAPTILDMAGLPIPSDFQGSSLLEPRARMALFFTDYSLGWLGLRDGCWKYTYETGAEWSRLYDVCVDPEETRDLSKLDLERVNRYREIVSRWIQPRSG
jgi:arylsulfatase A-like enzyme